MPFCAQILDATLLMPGLTEPVVPDFTPDPDADDVPAARAVPAGLRRRLSPLGRTVAEAVLAIPGALDDPKTALVFVSRWGDISLSLNQIRGLVENEELSPTAFATSVHNGIAGQLTIAAHHTGFVTAIAGGDAPFSRGFRTAARLLTEYEKVLLVTYDEGVVPSDPKRYAAAILLTRFEPTPDDLGYRDLLRGPVLTMEDRNPNDPKATKGLPDPIELYARDQSGATEPLAMLRWLLSEEPAIVTRNVRGMLTVFAKSAPVTVRVPA